MRRFGMLCLLVLAGCTPSASSDGCRSAPPLPPPACPGVTVVGIACDDAANTPICRDGIVVPTDPNNPSERGQESCVRCADAPGNAFRDGCYLSGAGYCVHDCSSC